MTTRPDDFPLKAWSKLKDDADKSHAAKVWLSLTDGEKAEAKALTPADCAELLVTSKLPGDDTGGKTVVTSTGQTISDQVKSIVDTLLGDTAIKTEMVQSIIVKMDAQYRTLNLCQHIQRLKLVLPRYERDVHPDWNNPKSNTLHDAFPIPAKTKRGNASTGHRLYVIYDDVFANLEVNGIRPKAELKQLSDMSKDDKGKMGDDVYKAKRADTQQPLTIGRGYFVAAANATHAMADINEKYSDVRVVWRMAADKKTIERSQKPLELQEIETTTDGKTTTIAIKRATRIGIASDLLKYNLERAEEVMGTVVNDVTIASNYDALIESKSSAGKTNEERYTELRDQMAAVMEKIRKAGGDLKALLVNIGNAQQADSAMADLGSLFMDDAKFRTDYMTMIVNDKASCLSGYRVLQGLQTLYTPQLLTRAKMLDDADRQKDAA